MTRSDGSSQVQKLKIAMCTAAMALALVHPKAAARQPHEEAADGHASDSRGKQDTRVSPPVRALQLAIQCVAVGTSQAEVLKSIGKPDSRAACSKERTITSKKPEGGLAFHNSIATERWSYGVLWPGTYAADGIIEFDSQGRVVTADTPDSFARHRRFDGVIIPAAEGIAAQPVSGLSCLIDAVAVERNSGARSSWFRLEVSVRNDGAERFTLTHDAARSIRWFFVTELYDHRHRLIHRLWAMLHHSPYAFDRTQWPTLTILPGQRVVDEIPVQLDAALGSLPSGKYFLRVAFPLKEGAYYHSNEVSCEIE